MARARTILTGFALATSWTWCIGMFAPFVMGQRWGWPGILAFAVPNVLGCALFGYLRSRERSIAETRDHAWAFAAFSAATVAYQVFFAGWLGGPVVAEANRAALGESTALVAGLVFAAAVALSFLPRRALWLVAALAYPVSLATFLFLPWDRMHALPASGEWTPAQLAFVLPTIVFGFALSPNLDLTFHRARQEASDPARPREFAVFGVAFASMLALTCAYLAAPNGLTVAAVRVHILMQLVLTSALHLNELRAALIAPTGRAVLGVGAGLAGLVAAISFPGEDTYMRFLGLYGLVFPAYAALALRARGKPPLLGIVATAVAVAAVAPIVDRAFIDGPTPVALLGFLVPLAAALAFGRPRAAPRIA
ncbi:MAG: hypothetical protein LW636_02630 [Planctomycetaceae bacterium]|nr:hypothetical protein [Planctomycetaceae bacterium]